MARFFASNASFSVLGAALSKGREMILPATPCMVCKLNKLLTRLTPSIFSMAKCSCSILASFSGVQRLWSLIWMGSEISKIPWS